MPGAFPYAPNKKAGCESRPTFYTSFFFRGSSFAAVLAADADVAFEKSQPGDQCEQDGSSL
jgi:hypothetical protein